VELFTPLSFLPPHCHSRGSGNPEAVITMGKKLGIRANQQITQSREAFILNWCIHAEVYPVLDTGQE